MFNPFTSPIIKKDLKVISRSMRFSWGLFAYEAVLLLVFLMSLSIMNVSSSYYYGGVRSNVDIYEGFIYFFPIVGVTELVIIALIIPIITASSISGERERKTMDVLLTTTISSPAIILGKIGSAVIRVMIFIIASLPMLSLAFLVGGLSWLTLFKYIILAFIFACFAGSVGIFASSICKKSITAIILSYVIYLGIYGLPFVVMLLEYLANIQRNKLYVTPFALMVNPVYSFIVFFIGDMTSYNVNDELFNSSNAVLSFIFNKGVYITISQILQLGLTILFVYFAAMRIKPGKK